MAKLCKVKVHDFAIGFGPVILKKQGKETLYTIRLFPLGGFVRMEGEEHESEEEGSFSKKSIPQKIAIVLAGASVNIIFGLIVYFILIASIGNFISNRVDEVKEGYGAQAAGILPNDKIIKINGKNINIRSDITKALENISGEEIEVQIIRNDEIKKFYVIPTKEYINNTTQYFLGVTFKKAERNLLSNIKYGFWDTVNFSISILDNLKLLFSGQISTDQLTGPIGISTMVANTDGIVEFVYLLALISLSLGITNLLPIPPLDGWKVVLYLIELVRRKPMDEKMQVNIEALGFAFMILLSIYVAYNDILRINI